MLQPSESALRLQPIRWHEGVVRNGVMSLEHDIFMLKAMQPDHSMDWLVTLMLPGGQAEQSEISTPNVGCV
jgi:hypothetical protein